MQNTYSEKEEKIFDVSGLRLYKAYRKQDSFPKENTNYCNVLHKAQGFSRRAVLSPEKYQILCSLCWEGWRRPTHNLYWHTVILPFSKTKEADTSGWAYLDYDPYRAMLVLCSFVLLATAGWTGGHLILAGIITFSLLGIWNWDSSLFTTRQSPEGHPLLGSVSWLFARGSRTSQAT